MRKIFLLTFILLLSMSASNAQTDKYLKQWQQVDTLIQTKGLPKSALSIVSDIYTHAKKSGNDDEMIKALLYKFLLEEKTTEKEINDVVNTLNKEVSTTKDPVAKSLLYTLQAQQLINYKNNNSWRIRQRNETSDYKKEDILTWSAQDFNEKISALFDTIFINTNKLKRAKLENYRALILKGNTPGLRLSMYDMLLHYKLNYYANNNDLGIKPADEFMINKPQYFLETGQFVKYPDTSADTLSSKFITVKTFQALLDYYIHQNATSALADTDVQRVAWIFNNAVLADKDSLYVQALKNILDKFPGDLYAKEAAFLLAAHYRAKASEYQPYKDSTHRLKNITAIEIIDKYATLDDSASAVIKLLNLKQEIRSVSLNTSTENINVSEKPFRALVKYKNTDEVFIRIIRWDFSQKQDFYSNSKFWRSIVKNKNIVQSFSQKLPLPNDYQMHSTEIKIDGLPAGRYVLLAGSDADFSIDHKLSAQIFDVSDIAYVQNKENYFVLHRETGKPVAGAVIHFRTDRNNNSPVYTTVTTDKKGYAKAPETKRGYNNGYITKGKDRIDFSANYYYRNNDDVDDNNGGKYEVEDAAIHFFTDRSLYRPGQTVYFKGILTARDYKTKETKLLPVTETLSIKLFDVNRKQIDSVSVKLNDYASFSGSFRLPDNVLTGNFSIAESVIDGSVNFSVEEYKRPTFFVEFDTLKTDYRLNDSITISGTAKAFAGNTIDNAQVKINVTRAARFPYSWMERGFMPSSPQAQIFNDVVNTDENGRFSFTFKASPDKSVDKRLKPVFNYEIAAAATDNNGESRSNTTFVRIGYQSLLLNILNEEQLSPDSLREIKISATNLSDQKIPARVTVKIFSLSAPDRLIRNRYWQRPDQFAIDKETYLVHFPHDEYDNETDKTTWKKERKVFSKTAEANVDKAFDLNRQRLNAGWYLIEALSKDKDGNDVEDKKLIRVFEEGAAKLSEKIYLWSTKVNRAHKTGDKDIFKIGTAADDVHVLQSKETGTSGKRSKEVVSDFVLNNEIKTFTTATTKANEHATKTVYGFIKHNRFYTTDNTVLVWDDNKILNIKYATYRDKTEPGAKEKWQIKISGQNDTEVVAELLSAMYDTSLDEIRSHSWNIPFTDNRRIPHNSWDTDYRQFSQQQGFENYITDKNIINIKDKIYDKFIFENDIYINNALQGRMYGLAAAPSTREDYDKEFTTVQEEAYYKGDNATKAGNLAEIKVLAPKSGEEARDITIANKKKDTESPSTLRTNFNETAFFMPQVYADKNGMYTIEFTMPDALTKWRWMNLAYTKTLQYAYSENAVVSQKTMMVQPNMPRFLRAGDRVELSVKISNLSENSMSGKVQIQLLNALSREPVTGWINSNATSTDFTVPASQSTAVKFPLNIPAEATEPIVIKVAGTSGNFSDGEEHIIPVLPNKMLVTEAMPIFQQGDTIVNYTFDKFKNHTSNTLQTQSLTVEFTANPVWYAVQSLPYLMEYPYECAEQVFNRFYANALATHIVNTNPGIKKVFDEWQKDSTTLQSNLQKNQELKQVLLQETPWVMQAENEAEKKKNIALLFDLLKMHTEINKSINKLSDMQMSNGAFPWFKGGYADRYITQYILTGIGRLKMLKAIPDNSLNTVNQITKQARQYLQTLLTKDYNELLKKQQKELSKNNISGLQIQYLFANSYFNPKPVTEAEKYYYGQAKKYWNEQSSYLKGMLAGLFYRSNEKVFAKESILKSLLENAVEDKAQGTYWKDMHWGYYWYEAPVEQQALMIEITNEIAEDAKESRLKESVNGMQNWLIRNKQTTSWKTTKATADACYALLKVNNLTAANKTVTIQTGGKTISSGQQGQAGTGYLKQTFTRDEITRDMADIKVATSSEAENNFDKTPAYGSVYWQYFEEMNKITAASTPLSLKKQLFIEKNTDAGKKLIPVNNGDVLSIGDKIIVRIELRSDRDMEYLHLKDMRAASMEPVNVLSRYKWQDGLGYYEAAKDASANFFISYLRKGVYVFDYPLYITHSGEYSVGIASIQCMYAPAFTSHSAGIRIKVK